MDSTARSHGHTHREIIKLSAKYDPSSRIRGSVGRPHGRKVSRSKHSGQDDINKLFEAVNIGNPCQEFGQPVGRNCKEMSHKSAMKRPMRVSPSRTSSDGITESISLKQALRGLCISQASEMALVKKRRLRLSSSPGISDAGAIKRLYRAVVTEAPAYGRLHAEGKGNSGKISLMPEPERGPSKNSHESKVEAPEKTAASSSAVFVDALMQKKLPGLDESVPISYESGLSATGKNKEEQERLQFESSSSLGNKVVKPLNRAFGYGKQGLRGQNIAKKKNVLKTALATKIQTQLSEGSTDDHDCHQTETVQEDAGVESNTYKHDLVPCSFIKTTRVAATRVDERSTSLEKGEISQSSKSSIGEYSSSSYSDESYPSVSSRNGCRPHMSKDVKWEAIRSVQKQHGSLGLRHFKLLMKLGGGDIGNVYLSELTGTNCLFAVKMMDCDLLASRKKLLRAQSEKEILEILDHPFLPTLYAHFMTKKFSCLIMEHCPGGDLHVLRQKQPAKSFIEQSARFYVAEVLLALEYLHMLGIVYRDLKPENILIREDGHIMLSDFDLSLRCKVNPILLMSSSPVATPRKKMPSTCSDSSCISPFCLSPSWPLSCFTPTFFSTSAKTRKLKSEPASQIIPLPQLVVEPISARSNSFVGTHEYLAPEIVKEEGHGSAVDWWTFGILLFELLYGKTPFKGTSNEETISNVVSQCLKFPECPMVSSHARDLISSLLEKEPEKRLGSEKGAAEIKQHPFFNGLNWALIRCTKPPELPPKFDLGSIVVQSAQNKSMKSHTESEYREDEEFETF